MSTQYIDLPVEGGGVVSLNGLTGALSLVAGSGITITPSGTNITIASTSTGGLTSINSDTTAAQTLTIGTAGTDFAITDIGSGGHVFNLPTASAVNRGALSSTDWTVFNNKGSGSVTSVGLSLPASVFNVSGSPVTTSGTLTGAFATQSANTMFTGPVSGAAATPTFRALVLSDIPSLASLYANVNLSNLASPTAINQSILDGTDNTHNIGAAAGISRFANGYFGTSIAVGTFPLASSKSCTNIVPAAITIYGGGTNAYNYQLGPSSGIAISNAGSGGRLITLSDVSVAFAGGLTGVNYLTSILGLTNIFGHFRATTTAPIATVNANAGTGATSTVANATDVAGIVNLTLGSIATPASGVQTTINFNTAYTTAPIVVITPSNAITASNMAAFGVYIGSTTSGFTINFATAGVALDVLQWHYHIIETQ